MAILNTRIGGSPSRTSFSVGAEGLKRSSKWMFEAPGLPLRRSFKSRFISTNEMKCTGMLWDAMKRERSKRLLRWL
uniref:Uncharacterized protein n=1 Tax=Solanum lycopersicum TaxID=4081 RepID=A0A3Q7J455_SOLLC